VQALDFTTRKSSEIHNRAVCCRPVTAAGTRDGRENCRAERFSGCRRLTRHIQSACKMAFFFLVFLLVAATA
jgi:hypothetical protein